MKWYDSVLAQREICRNVLWWFLGKLDRWWFVSFAPFPSTLLLSCCLEFQGHSRLLSSWIMVRRASMGMAGQCTEGASPPHQPLAAWIFTSFCWQRYNLSSCLCHDFSGLRYMQADLVLTDTLFYYRSVWRSSDFIVHLRTDLCVYPLTYSALSNHLFSPWSSGPGLDVGLVSENNWYEKFY